MARPRPECDDRPLPQQRFVVARAFARAPPTRCNKGPVARDGLRLRCNPLDIHGICPDLEAEERRMTGDWRPECRWRRDAVGNSATQRSPLTYAQQGRNPPPTPKQTQQRSHLLSHVGKRGRHVVHKHGSLITIEDHAHRASSSSWTQASRRNVTFHGKRRTCFNIRPEVLDAAVELGSLQQLQNAPALPPMLAPDEPACAGHLRPRSYTNSPSQSLMFVPSKTRLRSRARWLSSHLRHFGRRGLTMSASLSLVWSLLRA